MDPDGNVSWAQQYDPGVVYSLSVSRAGVIAVMLSIFGKADFGGVPVGSDNSASVVVAVLEPDGALRYAKELDVSGASAYGGLSLIVDDAGAVTISGAFIGTLDFGDGQIVTADKESAILVRLGPTGQGLWTRTIGGGKYLTAGVMADTETGDLILTGPFAGTLDFGGVSISEGTGQMSSFVARFDSGGQPLWARAFGGLSEETALELFAPVAVADGTLIFAGSLYGVADLGNGQPTSSDNPSPFILKLEDNGDYIYHQFFYQDEATLGGFYVAADAAGNITATFSFTPSFKFGGGSLVSAGGWDTAVLKLDPAGDTMWVGQSGDDYDQVARGVAAASDGRTFIVESTAAMQELSVTALQP
jgi:hypothetical protein